MAISRRALMVYLSAATIVRPAQANIFSNGMGEPWAPSTSNPPDAFDPDASFFTAAERAFVTAAVNRLIPEDDFPSASDAGVVVFLENQLSGGYGRGDVYYMQGPFKQGLPTQGYQQRAPAMLYRQAIADIEAYLKASNGKTFTELEESAQDAFLTELSEGKIELEHVDAKTFFDTFWQDTQLGYLCDPVYGGNRDMISWKMIGYPGARYDYRPYINHDGRKLDLEPVSVAGHFAQGDK